MEVGTVIATENSPSPSEFSFVVTVSDQKIPVRKGQFVEVQTEEGKVIAFVTNVFKTNRYFMRAESVREYEKSGRPLTSIFPADRWEYIVANARILGVQTENGIDRTSFPPSPGQKVFDAENNGLAKFLGLDENGVEIGKLRYHDLSVKLNLDELLRKHVAVLSQSGSGKSYTSAVIIEELLDREREKGRLAVVVVDVHGEYTSMAENSNGADYSDRVIVVRGDEIKIGIPNLSAYQFMEFVPEMTGIQARELQRVLNELHNDMRLGKGPFGLDKVITKIENGEVHKQLQHALLGWLFDLNSLDIFYEVDHPNWGNIVQPGRAVIIDLSDTTNLRKKQIIVTYLARKLFNLRRSGKVPPFVLCLEEAHQFAPEGSAISKGILETIAREGRKFYASLILISQRPVRLSTTVLSQANTNIILRVTNPYDLDHIKQSSECITSEVIDMISSLPVGEALIVGEAVNYPIFVKIRKRRSRESKHGASLEDAAKEFEKNYNSTKNDATAFL